MFLLCGALLLTVLKKYPIGNNNLFSRNYTANLVPIFNKFYRRKPDSVLVFMDLLNKRAFFIRFAPL
ncbi:MAG: hypothetical protein BGO70_10320 [Bacteroidetes bacterium 43-93]|nr:MAG: hypothetical protein BGO70_10320 [Bacteroidetes bacterium 43-93]